MNETINLTFPMQRFSLQQSSQLQSSVNRIKASVKNRGRGCSARSWTFTVASAPRSSARYRTTPSSRLANNTQSAHQWPRITSLAVAPPEAGPSLGHPSQGGSGVRRGGTAPGSGCWHNVPPAEQTVKEFGNRFLAVLVVVPEGNSNPQQRRLRQGIPPPLARRSLSWSPSKRT